MYTIRGCCRVCECFLPWVTVIRQRFGAHVRSCKIPSDCLAGVGEGGFFLFIYSFNIVLTSFLFFVFFLAQECVDGDCGGIWIFASMSLSTVIQSYANVWCESQRFCSQVTRNTEALFFFCCQKNLTIPNEHSWFRTCLASSLSPHVVLRSILSFFSSLANSLSILILKNSVLDRSIASGGQIMPYFAVCMLRLMSHLLCNLQSRDAILSFFFKVGFFQNLFCFMDTHSHKTHVIDSRI